MDGPLEFILHEHKVLVVENNFTVLSVFVDICTMPNRCLFEL